MKVLTKSGKEIETNEIVVVKVSEVARGYECFVGLLRGGFVSVGHFNQRDTAQNYISNLVGGNVENYSTD